MSQPSAPCDGQLDQLAALSDSTEMKRTVPHRMKGYGESDAERLWILEGYLCTRRDSSTCSFDFLTWQAKRKDSAKDSSRQPIEWMMVDKRPDGIAKRLNPNHEALHPMDIGS